MDAPDKEVKEGTPSGTASKGEAPKEDLTGLYDLAIPLGMPVSVIREIVENFDVDVVKRKAKVDMTDTAGEVVDRELLVFRGDLDTIMAAKKYMFEALDKTVNKWDERKDRYKAVYEARLKELAEERKKEAAKQQDEVKPSDLVP